MFTGKEEGSCDSADQIPTAISRPHLAREDNNVLESIQDRYYDNFIFFYSINQIINKAGMC